MNLVKKAAAIILFWFAATCVFADDSPVTLLQGIADHTISELKAQRLNFKDHPAAVNGLVRKNILPYVDMTLLSRAVLGKYWNEAAPAQQSEFIRRFTSILIGTYASALAAYRDETVKFSPVRGGYAGKNNVLVESQIIRQGGAPIPVSYRVVRRGPSWKVYDLMVDNVSLIQNYRAQFSSLLQNANGMSGLLQSMAKHNAKNG